jgi:hypothetical protein
MALFLSSMIRENCLHGLEKKGFLPSMDVLGWRMEGKGEVPHPGDDEVVVHASFYERGYDLSFHPFRAWAHPLLSAKVLKSPT